MIGTIVKMYGLAMRAAERMPILYFIGKIQFFSTIWVYKLQESDFFSHSHLKAPEIVLFFLVLSFMQEARVIGDKRNKIFVRFKKNFQTN